MEYRFEAEIGERLFSIRAGGVARQSSGAVLVQYADTVVLVTVVSENEAKPGTDFLPLSVEYQERIYAAGRIPGNYYRREVGRPSEKETLTARLIDRPIRPLFPKGYSFETQVIATVLSMDQENEPDTLAMTGASAALEISDIPFEGPIAAVRVVRLDGRFIVNPTLKDCEHSDINIIVAGSKQGIVMVEGGSSIVSESDMLEAIFFGHQALQPLIDVQLKLKETISKPKRIFAVPKKDGKLAETIQSLVIDRVRNSMKIPGKVKRNETLRIIRSEVFETIGKDNPGMELEIDEIFNDIKKVVTRDMILNHGQRIDGRKFDEIRHISCEVGILPRPHGSAMFTRGETQVMGVLTIGSGQDEQRIETLSGEECRPFMLHYNFPPFSVGEAKRLSGPSRREVGHGGLSTRAVEKILPIRKEFDYTLRVVSEVLESNGSSSMATVCAASLALMDGGVPIKNHVAGIAMGLVKEGDRVAILSDIIGDEDHMGDMDFKVAGTREGITALQMDIKIREISKQILTQALEQARCGRLFIIDQMEKTIATPRGTISPYAPKIVSMQIKPDKIRDIIGPAGKVIRALQTETNTRIEVSDTGLVKISAMSTEDAQSATRMINEITLDPEVGNIYEGTVVKTTDFGAFVRIIPGTEGLVHISQLASHRVKKVTDIVNEGDIIKVKVLEISRDGKIRLSHKAVLEEENASST